MAELNGFSDAASEVTQICSCIFLAANMSLRPFSRGDDLDHFWMKVGNYDMSKTAMTCVHSVYLDFMFLEGSFTFCITHDLSIGPGFEERFY